MYVIVCIFNCSPLKFSSAYTIWKNTNHVYNVRLIPSIWKWENWTVLKEVTHLHVHCTMTFWKTRYMSRMWGRCLQSVRKNVGRIQWYVCSLLRSVVALRPSSQSRELSSSWILENTNVETKIVTFSKWGKQVVRNISIKGMPPYAGRLKGHVFVHLIFFFF